MWHCVGDISFGVDTECGVEQPQWRFNLFTGLESCELHYCRPSGGNAVSTQHTEADSGIKTRKCL